MGAIYGGEISTEQRGYFESTLDKQTSLKTLFPSYAGISDGTGTDQAVTNVLENIKPEKNLLVLRDGSKNEHYSKLLTTTEENIATLTGSMDIDDPKVQLVVQNLNACLSIVSNMQDNSLVGHYVQKIRERNLSKEDKVYADFVMILMLDQAYTKYLSNVTFFEDEENKRLRKHSDAINILYDIYINNLKDKLN